MFYIQFLLVYPDFADLSCSVIFCEYFNFETKNFN